MSSPTRRSSPCNTAPQMCRSTNRRSSVAEPEVWFRIVHITLDCHGTLVAAHREQTVEIALGPRRPGRERRPATSDHANNTNGSMTGLAKIVDGGRFPPLSNPSTRDPGDR